jgi:hypothetical protein
MLLRIIELTYTTYNECYISGTKDEGYNLKYNNKSVVKVVDGDFER